MIAAQRVDFPIPLRPTTSDRLLAHHEGHVLEHVGVAVERVQPVDLERGPHSCS